MINLKSQNKRLQTQKIYCFFRLRPIKKIDFQSGDLMSISLQGYKSPRLYCVGKLGKEILLSIQWYPNEICSSYICSLNIGDTIQGIFKKITNSIFQKKQHLMVYC